jgi:hypothetical protein
MKEETNPTWKEVHGGYAKDMTMRDELAGRAMQGLLTHENCQGATWDEIPKYAYEMADAMLKAREGK